MKDFRDFICDVAMCVGVWLIVTGGGVSAPSFQLPSIFARHATAAVYVYEKDTTSIPTGVASGLNRLNRERHIVATSQEVDTKNGSGEVPAQYKVPVAAAQSAGLPALVATNGARVLKVTKAPATEEQTIGGVP